MARKRLLLQLCILVEDLDDRSREQMARDLLLNDLDEPEELPRLADYDDPEEIGDVVADFFSSDTSMEMLAGSELYVTFHSAQMLSAEWKTEQEG